MKSLFFSCLSLFFVLTAVAQKDDPNSGRMVGTTFRNSSTKAKKPLGSPYISPAFAVAKVENLNISAPMRYNAFGDEFEFITTKNDTLILDKIEDFSHIVFSGNKRNYHLVIYVNSKNSLTNGYLIELYNKSNYTLFEKENISFTEEKVAKTTLEVGMPARYTKTDDTYFLRMPNGNTTEFPDGKKALAKLFPDKKQAIETFVKTNKIDFDNEADLVKVIDFLAAL